MSRPVILRGRKGFGDAIYMRPSVAARTATGRDVYLETPWPQVFQDLPVGLLPLPSGLTWSQINISRQPPEVWATRPAGAVQVDARYLWAELSRRSMAEQMADRMGVRVSRFTLPPLPPPPVSAEAPLAVIRPVTGRNDWVSTARNPKPEYMIQASHLLARAGYHVVSVAAIQACEPYLGEPPFAHTRFDNAELSPLELLALVRSASLVVAGPGWLVPAALAAGTPLIVLAGGAGATNGPQALVPTWYRGRVSWLIPDGYCRCRHKEHTCPKEIPDFEGRFVRAMAQVAPSGALGAA